MPTNKVKVEFWATHEQKNDFLWAINDILMQGAKDEGRAAQLLAQDYKSGHYEERNNK
jgi:hypothetical protein